MALAAPPLRLPSTVEPGHEQSPPAETQEAPEGDFDLSITAPRRAAIPKDVETLRFTVKRIEIEGSTVFTHGDLLPLVQPLIGREVTLREITAVAEAIEARYREEGFLLTRVFVPPQRTRDGNFTIEVVEAFIKTIIVDGVDGDLKDRIEAILRPVSEEKPLSSATMERALLLVNDLPGVHAVGLLKPSADEVGAADLQVSASVKMLAASTSGDNRSSRYSGPVIANADMAVNSLANQGEQIGLGVSRSIDPSKQRGIRAHLIQPIGNDGLLATSSFDLTLGRPGYSLAPLGIATDSLTISQRLSYPLIRGRSFNLFADAGLSWKLAKTESFGTLLSEDQWRVADFKLSWSQAGWLDGLTSGSVDAAKGLPIAGASHPHAANLSRADGNPDFTKIDAELHRIQPLGSTGFTLSLSGSVQHAFDPLLAGEEFSLGGYQYGRGFDPAALSADNGIGGSAELQYDPAVSGLDRFEPYLFFDRGATWGHDSRIKSSLASAGGGFRISFSPNIDLDIEGARRLYGPVPSVLPDLQTRLFMSVTGRF